MREVGRRPKTDFPRGRKRKRELPRPGEEDRTGNAPALAASVRCTRSLTTLGLRIFDLSSPGSRAAANKAHARCTCRGVLNVFCRCRCGGILRCRRHRLTVPLLRSRVTQNVRARTPSTASRTRWGLLPTYGCRRLVVSWWCMPYVQFAP